MQENIQSQMFEEFEKFLEDRIKKLKEGEIVEGEVIKVEGDKVYVDIGLKSEGIVALYEFRKPPQKGDKVKVYIDAIDVRGGTTLVSKHKADFILAWDKINTAYQNNETLEVEVVRQVKGGLMVDVFGVEAFLPGSQIDIKNNPQFMAVYAQSFLYKKNFKVADKIIDDAFLLARKLHHKQVLPMHLFFASLSNREVTAIFSRLDIDKVYLINKLKEYKKQ